MGNKSTKKFNGTVKARQRRKNVLERLTVQRDFILKKLQESQVQPEPDVVPKKLKKKKKLAENKNFTSSLDLERIDKEIAILKTRI